MSIPIIERLRPKFDGWNGEAWPDRESFARLKNQEGIAMRAHTRCGDLVLVAIALAAVLIVRGWSRALRSEVLP